MLAPGRARAAALRSLRGALAPAAATAVAIAVACSEVTAPTAAPVAHVSVAVHVERVDPPVVTRDTAGHVRVSCNVALTAVGTGTGEAKWGEAVFRWYAGKDRTTAVDSTVMIFFEVTSSWGDSAIAAGETQHSGWRLTASMPFDLSIEYRYRPGPAGEVDTASVRFSCGPSVTPDAPPPTISMPVTIPATGVLQPGDILTISFSAASRSGVFQTAVWLSGPCDTTIAFVEHLEDSVAHFVQFPLPASCQLGVPLAIGAAALDGAGEQALQVLYSPLSVEDHTAPRITPTFDPPYRTSGTADSVQELFAGDSIGIQITATDNHALAAVNWEVWPTGFRDSILVSGAVASRYLYLRLRPEWIGTVQLRFTARDAVGNVSTVRAWPTDSLRVRPRVDLPITTTTVPGAIQDVLIDERRSRLYLLRSDRQQVMILSTATLAITDSVPLPDIPRDLDLTAGGDSLLVLLPNARALAVIDLRADPLSPALVPLPPLRDPVDELAYYVRAASNGKAFVATVRANRMLEVDLATGTVRIRFDAGNGGFTGDGMLERSHDHMVLVLNGGDRLFQRYDAVADRFAAPVAPYFRAVRPVIDGTGANVAISRALYDASLHLMRVAHTPGEPTGLLAYSPDGLFLYSFQPGYGIVRSRVSDGGMEDLIRYPYYTALLRASPDGSLLVAAHYPDAATSDRIAVIHLR